MTAPAPTGCLECGGTGLEWRENTSYAEVVYGGADRWQPTGRPCPDCCCGICGQPTDTPPECLACASREEATAKRRDDR